MNQTECDRILSLTHRAKTLFGPLPCTATTSGDAPTTPHLWTNGWDRSQPIASDVDDNDSDRGSDVKYPTFPPINEWNETRASANIHGQTGVVMKHLHAGDTVLARIVQKCHYGYELLLTSVMEARKCEPGLWTSLGEGAANARTWQGMSRTNSLTELGIVCEVLIDDLSSIYDVDEDPTRALEMYSIGEELLAQVKEVHEAMEKVILVPTKLQPKQAGNFYTTFNALLEGSQAFHNPGLVSSVMRSESLYGKGSFLPRARMVHSDAFDHFRREQNRKAAVESLEKGVNLAKSGKQEDAMKMYNHALALDSKYTDAWVAKGAAYANVKQFTKAIEQFDRALELEPDHRNAIQYRSICVQRMEDAEAALRKEKEEEEALERLLASERDKLRLKEELERDMNAKKRKKKEKKDKKKKDKKKKDKKRKKRSSHHHQHYSSSSSDSP